MTTQMLSSSTQPSRGSSSTQPSSLLAGFLQIPQVPTKISTKGKGKARVLTSEDYLQSVEEKEKKKKEEELKQRRKLERERKAKERDEKKKELEKKNVARKRKTVCLVRYGSQI